MWPWQERLPPRLPKHKLRLVRRTTATPYTDGNSAETNIFCKDIMIGMHHVCSACFISYYHHFQNGHQLLQESDISLLNFKSTSKEKNKSGWDELEDMSKYESGCFTYHNIQSQQGQGHISQRWKHEWHPEKQHLPHPSVKINNRFCFRHWYRDNHQCCYRYRKQTVKKYFC